LAVVWKRTKNDTHFEVRRAGSSLRLYTNGVFHSQYNPARPIAANVWNLLLLPAFFRPAGTIRRVLVLGVGGGAIIRLLDHCIRPETIIGVELDPTHLYIARRFFGVTEDRARLIEADAVDWLAGYKGPKFDLIIDDLYGEADGEPVRTIEAGQAWLSKLSQNLADDGVLVMNFVSSRVMRDTSRMLQTTSPTQFANAYRLSLPAYENVVGAFISQSLGVRPLRQVLRTASVPCASSLSRLSYRIQRILP